MSLTSSLERIVQAKADIRLAIIDKGVAVSEEETIANYSSYIENINTGGVTPTGTISITQNGTYDVTSYASAEVDVPTGSAISDVDPIYWKQVTDTYYIPIVMPFSIQNVNIVSSTTTDPEGIVVILA